MSMLRSSWAVCLIAAGDTVQAEFVKQQRCLGSASAKRGQVRGHEVGQVQGRACICVLDHLADSV